MQKLHLQYLQENNTSMKRSFFSIIAAVVIIAAMTGCKSHQKVVYFQNADSVSLSASRMLYDAKIMPKDELSITVSCSNPEAATQFNLAVSEVNSSTGSKRMNTGGAMLLPYLVDNDGTINFPVIGTLKVGGLTKNECQDLILSKIKPYFSANEKPVVTVRTSNYRVTVMGEVNSPGVFSVGSEKMSILEAIAQAHDLTIYGKRENILVIREDANGEKSMHRMNLNDANIVSSPYYYLQQNDIVYVEPNKTKAANSDIGTVTTFTMSIISTLMSVASLVINIIR